MIRILALLLVITSSPAVADDATASALLDRAENHLRHGRTRAAVIELKNAAKEAPQNARIRLRLGQIHLASNAPRAAAKELRRAWELGAADDEVVPALAQALIESGDLLEAIDVINDAAEPSPRLLALRGEAHLATGDAAAAETDFEAALAIHPTLLPALRGQARLALERGQPAAAMRWASRTLSAAPNSAEAWSLLGRLEAANKNYDAALRAFEQALRLQPDSQPMHLAAATVLLVQKDFDAAQVHLDAVAAIAPDSPQLLSLSATLSLAQGDAAAARDALQKVVSHYPQYAPAQLSLGRALLELEAYEQAIEVLRRYNALKPDTAEGSGLLGLALAHAGSSVEANKLLAPLAKRYPNDVTIMEAQRVAAMDANDFELATRIEDRIATVTEARANLSEAVDQFARGDKDAGMATLEQTSQQSPSLLQPKILRFRELVRARDLPAAEAVARELNQDMPDSALPPLFLGISLAGQGDLEGAQSEFETAWQRSPGNPAIAHRLALMALAHSDQEAAIGYYREAVAQHPGHSDTLKRLATLTAAQGDRDQAFAYLRQNVEQHPADLEPRLQLARALAADQRPEEAIATLQEVEGPFANDAGFLGLLAQTQIRTDPSTAVVTARRLVDVAPQVPLYHLLLAEALGRSGDDAGLYDALRAGLSLDTPSGVTNQQLIRLTALAQARIPALDMLDRLQQALPDNAEVVRALSSLALGQGRVDDALALIRDMAKRQPDQPEWMRSEAQILTRIGQPAQTKKVINDWRARHPQDPTADLVEADLAMARGDHSTAIAGYGSALQIDPDNLQALNNTAWLIRDSDPVRALELARRAAAASNRADVLDTLGVVLLANQKPKQAIQVLRAAAVRDRNATSTLFHLAQALVANGNVDTAEKLLARLLKRPGTFAQREQAEALLAELQKRS